MREAGLLPSPAGEGGSRRLTDEELLSNFAFLKICLPKPKAFAVLFRFRAEFTERSIFGAVGGIRCGNFAVRKGEQMKFKFFAIP